MPCSGDPVQNCGGPDRIYIAQKLDGTASSTASTPTSTPVTTTATPTTTPVSTPTPAIKATVGTWEYKDVLSKYLSLENFKYAFDANFTGILGNEFSYIHSQRARPLKLAQLHVVRMDMDSPGWNMAANAVSRCYISLIYTDNHSSRVRYLPTLRTTASGQ